MSNIWFFFLFIWRHTGWRTKNFYRTCKLQIAEEARVKICTNDTLDQMRYIQWEASWDLESQNSQNTYPFCIPDHAICIIFSPAQLHLTHGECNKGAEQWTNKNTDETFYIQCLHFLTIQPRLTCAESKCMKDHIAVSLCSLINNSIQHNRSTGNNHNSTPQHARRSGCLQRPYSPHHLLGFPVIKLAGKYTLKLFKLSYF